MTPSQKKRQAALRRLLDRDRKRELEIEQAALASLCGPYCRERHEGWIVPLAIGFCLGCVMMAIAAGMVAK